MKHLKTILIALFLITLGCEKEMEFAPQTEPSRNIECEPILSLKVGAWLQAAYDPNTNKMKNLLTQQALTPNLTNQQQSVSNHNAIVDWVVLSLMNANGVIVGSANAVIQADGDIRQPSGGNVHIQAPYGTYRVVVNHRNHLPAVTVAKYIGSDTQTFDLRSGSHYGSCGQVQLESGVWGLWGGDANGDEKVIYSGPNNDAAYIYNQVVSDPLNAFVLPNYIVAGKYLNSDVTMDGNTIYSGNNNDAAFIFSNVLMCPCNTYSLPNYIITSQFP